MSSIFVSDLPAWYVTFLLAMIGSGIGLWTSLLVLVGLAVTSRAVSAMRELGEREDAS